MASSLGIINELSSFINALSSFINALSSFINAINENNPEIYSFTSCWGGGTSTSSDCLPICIRLQGPQPAKTPRSLWNMFLGPLFRVIVVLSTSLPSSSPPLPAVLFAAARLVSFAVSFAGLRLQNAHPGIAYLLGRIGSLIAAIGVCIISSLLVHQNFAWICWLACASIVLAFIISFK